MSVLRTMAKRLAGRLPPVVLERLLAFPIFEQDFAAIRKTKVFATRQQLWADLLTRVGDKPLCYLEFGVWQGESIRFFAEHDSNPRTLLFGFDSFEGLPEDWAAFQPKGHFSTQGQVPQISDQRVRFVKGWFNETLEAFLGREKAMCESITSGERTLVVHLDADLFSSTLYVLSVLTLRFDRYYFVFDEFIGDEARALREIRRAFGLHTEFFGYTSAGGYPMQLSGMIARESKQRTG